MTISEHKIITEKVAAYIKVSKEMLELGYNSDDFITDQLTAQMVGFVYSAAKENGELMKTIEVPRPSFLDWLLRRKKYITVSIPYEISHLVKVTDLPEFNSPTMPIIRHK